MFNTKTLSTYFNCNHRLCFLGLSACHDDPEFATVQIIHASLDAPAVNVLANGTVTLQALDYRNVTGKIQLVVGTVSIDIQVLLPDMTTPSVIGITDLSLVKNTNTLVIAASTVANIEPLIITRDDASVSSDKTRLNIIHAAPNAPQVDIYVTAVFKDSSGELEVDSGD